MSLKGLFDKVTVAKSLVKKSQSEIAEEVESVNYHNADIVKEKRFIPPVDYSKPENFARYGSAEKYYADAIENVYTSYPYDGSLFERLAWENSSSYVDLYIFEERYPRTNGYINFSYGGWGSRTSTADGYGLPASTEYIDIKGGPHLGGGPQNQGANVWDPDNNRESNLELNPVEGTSIEFWLKKDGWDPTNETKKEVIFDLWNNEDSSSIAYGRFRVELTASGHGDEGANPILVTLMSGTTGFQSQVIGSSAITTASVGDGNWHHYALTFLSASTGVTTRLYLDGNLNTESALGSTGVGTISGSMLAYIGALRTTPSGTTANEFAGKLSASLDEFRYWKTQRSSKDIGRYWFTQVGGGTNTDLSNVDLGVYYKFNEGITGTASIDSVALDYSGRVTNGSWTGYAAGARNTGSAIVESKAAVAEFLDPIVYYTHPDVVALSAELKSSGSHYDYNNTATLYHMFPGWIQETDSEGAGELRNLTQIISSYFDSLQLELEFLPAVGDLKYVSGSEKPNVFAERLLDARGFLSPEIFLDADILEKLGDRSEKTLFSSSLNDTKNLIYQNIYNNLIHIYKSKGTMKSFRNLMRCYGIDEELIKINLYGNNVQYELRDNTTLAETRTKMVDFNHTDRFTSVVFQNSSSANPSSVSYISGAIELKNGFATTFETEIIFPKKFAEANKIYGTQHFTALSSSLFGLHKAIDATPADTTWAPGDELNFQVYAVRAEVNSTDVKFVLSSSADGSIPFLTSSVFDDVYQNSKWSFAVRIKPDTYPYSTYISGSDLNDHNCSIGFYGVHIDSGVVLDEFSLTASVLQSQLPEGFYTGSRRAYVGSHRQNFTGSSLVGSDVKVAACRYWFDYLDDDTMKAHAQNISNYGALYPSRPAYFFQNNLNLPEVMQIDTLALNWDFEQVTGSDASGEFIVADFSSGSSDEEGGRYNYLGPSLSYQHTGRGYGFPASSTKVTDMDFLISAKQNLPESLYADDMIKVLSQQDELEFTRESRPINFFFAFEKSMYQSISEEMINMFATIVDFNNVIGEPVNRYRGQYKRLNKLRNLFFERADNTPDLNKYIEFYKWFDSALSQMINQLVPASVDSSEGVRVVVENYILSRDKYQHKFPTLEMKMDDPEGPIQTVLNASPGWKYTHAPVEPSYENEADNAHWWRELAERNVAPLSSSDAGANTSRSMILRATRAAYDRRKNIPYRLDSDTSISSSLPIKGGPNPQYQKQRDVVYAAAAPAGPLVPGTNIPSNIMIAKAADVIEHQHIHDVLIPNEKKVMGFKLDPTINKDLDFSGKGELLAPFSLYSSSLDTGYNSVITTQFTGGILLTNLHPDMYGPTYEIPMQGPFTEKFVGGREHRHVWLNQSSSRNPSHSGLDTPEDRPEGFRILCGTCLSTSGALGIAGPQYPDPTSPAVVPPYLFDRPKANLLRIETAKRPVNIKNILMTSASLGTTLSGTIMHNQIGNYQHNYQVIQTAGRSLNDPFFQDQSFSFALDPQNPAPLPQIPRLPLQTLNVLNDTALHIEYDTDASTYGLYSCGTTPRTELDANKSFTLLMWVNPQVMSSRNIMFYNTTSPSARNFEIRSDGSLRFWAAWDGSGAYWTTTSTGIITTNNWYHVVVSYDEASTANDPNIYVNGVHYPVTENTAPAGSLVAWDATSYIGFTNSNQFDGYISDVALYNNILTFEEIGEIYDSVTLNKTQHSPPRVASNLVMWLRCGNGGSDTVASVYDEVDDIRWSAAGTNTPTSFAMVGDSMPARYSRNNFALPERTGSNSNHTIIVDKFSAPGSYEVMSLGYLAPPHEEKSAYNALPYRNLSVRSSGSGESGSIAVEDQLNKRRGLRTLETLHCGQFGADGQFGVGNVTSLAYVTIPSYQKVNRNTRKRIEYKDSSYESAYATTITGSRYDNAHVTHLIPQSDKQYAWITASVNPSVLFLGYDEASGSAPNISYILTEAVITSSVDFASFNKLSNNVRYWGAPKDNTGWGVTINHPTYVDFAGMNTIIYEPLTSSTYSYMIGYPSTVPAATGTADTTGNSDPLTTYINDTYVSGGVLGTTYSAIFGSVQGLNAILLNRNGPYGYCSFRQLQMGVRSNPVTRYERINNVISLRDLEITALNWRGNTITKWTEPAVSSEQMPMQHRLTSKNRTIGMMTDPPSAPLLQTLVMDHSFGNKITDFSNQNLNLKLGMKNETWRSDLYYNRINTLLLAEHAQLETDDSPFEDIAKVTLDYKQKVYPAAYNSYLGRNRTREIYRSDFIWHPDRARRSSTLSTGSALTRDYEAGVPSGTLFAQVNEGRNTFSTKGPGGFFPMTPDPWTGRSRAANYSRQSIYDAPWMGSSSLVQWRGGAAQALGVFSYQTPLVGVSVWPLDAPRTSTWDINNLDSGATGVGISMTVTGSNPVTIHVGMARSLCGNGGLLHNIRGFGGYASGNVLATPQYAMPIPMGQSFKKTPVLGGYAYNEVAEQAGRDPYPDYDDYMQRLRRLGKDYSVVPEFRISQHMEYYLLDQGGDFLADNKMLFEMTGALFADGNSSGSVNDGFFKTYSNSDFMKLFEVVNDDYNNKDTTNELTMHQDSLSLKCSALLRFLPYRGFYPAERTVQLASLFSASYGIHCSSSIRTTNTATEAVWVDQPAAFRAITDPIFGPGILFNSIKAGIAMESFIIDNSASLVNSEFVTNDGGVGEISDLANTGSGTSASYYPPTPQPEGFVAYGESRSATGSVTNNYMLRTLLNEDFENTAPLGGSRTPHGYSMVSKPFETLMEPKRLNQSVISSSWIYDQGIGYSSLAYNNVNWDGDPNTMNQHGCARSKWTGMGDRRYRYAMDNFLCAVSDLWMGGSPTAFVSKPQNQWLPVQKDLIYGMTLRIFRTLDPNVTITAADNTGDLADRTKFENYNRASAWGPPIAVQQHVLGGYSVDFQKWVPPYFYGYADLQIRFTASGDFPPTMEEIMTNSSYLYNKQRLFPTYGGIGKGVGMITETSTTTPGMNQVDASFDMMKQLSVIEGGFPEPGEQPGESTWVSSTTYPAWLIQTKWESPILNFADASITAPPTSYVAPFAAYTNGDPAVKTRGLWHQYGRLPVGDEGVFVEIIPGQITSDGKDNTTAPLDGDLAEICGFSADRKRIGQVDWHGRLEEAVVAVPFTVGGGGSRKFFRMAKWQTRGAIRTHNNLPTQVNVAPATQRMVNLMYKYVFPPTFDFVTNYADVDPFAMYIFEFAAKVNQDDLADMWQNLPPNSLSGENFKEATATIQHPILTDQFFNGQSRKLSSNIRWMVFKVKKRCPIDYNKVKRRDLRAQYGDQSVIPKNINTPYSYNWPYDYFSLVELVKLEEGIRYRGGEDPPEGSGGMTIPVEDDAPPGISLPGTPSAQRDTGDNS